MAYCRRRLVMVGLSAEVGERGSAVAVPVTEEESEASQGMHVPVSPGAMAARTRNLQIACSTIAVIAVLSVGVTLGVTRTRDQGGAGGGTAIKTSVIGDQIPLVVYQRWSGPGCANTEGLKHQAAYAPGDCLSLLDNGFGGPENRRFMYECSSTGDIVYKEWRASRQCAGAPDKTENRTRLQNCYQNEQTKEWEKLSCGMQLESIPGQAITRHGCGQGGGVGGGGGQGQSGGASRGRTIPLEFCIAYAGVSAKWSCLYKQGAGQFKRGDHIIVYQAFSGHACSQKVSCPRPLPSRNSVRRFCSLLLYFDHSDCWYFAQMRVDRWVKRSICRQRMGASETLSLRVGRWST